MVAGKTGEPLPASEPVADSAPPPADAPPVDQTPAPVAETPISDTPPPTDRPTIIVKKEEPKPIATPEPAAASPAGLDQAAIDAAVERRLAERAPAEQKSSRPDRHLEVFEKMEEMNPAYKGLSNQLKDFRPLEQAYRQRWQTNPDNAGKKFNPRDEEHNEFYDANEPKLNPEDYREAEKSLERSIIKKELQQELRAEIEPEMNEMRLHRQMEQARPKIEKAVNESLAVVMSGAFESVMSDGKGNLVLSADVEKKMQDENPALYAYAADQGDRVMLIVAELEKMDTLGASYRIDRERAMQLPTSGDTIRPHAEIADAMREVEQVILRENKTMRNGKQFLPIYELARLRQDIDQSNVASNVKQERHRALDGRFWSIGAADIKTHVIQKARGRLEQISKKIPKSTPKSPDAVAPRNGSTAKHEKPAADAVKPASSSGSDTLTSTDVIDSRPNSMKNTSSGAETVLSKWFGR